MNRVEKLSKELIRRAKMLGELKDTKPQEIIELQYEDGQILKLLVLENKKKVD